LTTSRSTERCPPTALLAGIEAKEGGKRKSGVGSQTLIFHFQSIFNEIIIKKITFNKTMQIRELHKNYYLFYNSLVVQRKAVSNSYRKFTIKNYIMANYETTITRN
jgi:hypothetical protein